MNLEQGRQLYRECRHSSNGFERRRRWQDLRDGIRRYRRTCRNYREDYRIIIPGRLYNPIRARAGVFHDRKDYNSQSNLSKDLLITFQDRRGLFLNLSSFSSFVCSSSVTAHSFHHLSRAVPLSNQFSDIFLTPEPLAIRLIRSARFSQVHPSQTLSSSP